jgi:hypothetical protein
MPYRRRFVGFVESSSQGTVPGGQVEVRDRFGDLATLYAGDTGSDEAYDGENPFDSGDGSPDPAGKFEFYVEPDFYTITVGAGPSATTYYHDLTQVSRTNYPNRLTLETEVAEGARWPNNTVIFDGTCFYRAKFGSTDIADLPGLEPIDVTPDHFGQNTTPGTTNMGVAINAAISYKAAQGGGDVHLFAVDYATSAPISKHWSVRLIGRGATQFLEPTNLAGGKAAYVAMLGTRIVALRSATWAEGRGVVETRNLGSELVIDAGMENLVVDAHEIADHAIITRGTCGSSFVRVGAGWSLVADWLCGPEAGGITVPFTQPKFDNCWCVSTGREYAGSGESYEGGWVFFGDARRAADDGTPTDIFSNANQGQMSGCFARTPTGYGFVFEDSDDFKLYGCTGSIELRSVSDYTFSTLSSNNANNYGPRHHMIEGHQGSVMVRNGKAPNVKASSSNQIIFSRGNSVNVTYEDLMLTTGTVVLASNVADGGTMTLPYPAGYTQADFSSLTFASGSVWVDSAEYVVEKAGVEDIAVTFGVSNITVTNNSGVTWTTGQSVYLTRIYPAHNRGTLGVIQTANSAALTEEMPSKKGFAPVGVLLNRNTSFSIPHNANTMVPWTTAQFELGGEFWSLSEPTKIIVPKGIFYVSLAAGVVWEASASTGTLELHIIKNGFGTVGMPKQQTPATGGNESLNVYHAVVPVKEGDYFQVRVFQTSGSALEVTPNVATWFQMIAW